MNLTNFIGKNMIAFFFILTALYAIFFDFNGYVDRIKAKNLPLPMVLAILALAVKFLGGFSIVLGRYQTYGVIMLLIFMVLATLIFHNAFVDQGQFGQMMKNLGIMGGLLMIMD